jgi:hypothetical protein
MMRKARIAYIWSAIPRSTDIDRGHNNIAAGSKSVRLAASRCFPLFNQFQTFVYAAGGAASCQRTNPLTRERAARGGGVRGNDGVPAEIG